MTCQKERHRRGRGAPGHWHKIFLQPRHILTCVKGSWVVCKSEAFWTRFNKIKYLSPCRQIFAVRGTKPHQKRTRTLGMVGEGRCVVGKIYWSEFPFVSDHSASAADHFHLFQTLEDTVPKFFEASPVPLCRDVWKSWSIFGHRVLCGQAAQVWPFFFGNHLKNIRAWVIIVWSERKAFRWITRVKKFQCGQFVSVEVVAKRGGFDHEPTTWCSQVLLQLPDTTSHIGLSPSTVKVRSHAQERNVLLYADFSPGTHDKKWWQICPLKHRS